MDSLITQQRILEIAAHRGVSLETANVFASIGRSNAFTLDAAYRAFGQLASGLDIQLHEHSHTNHPSATASLCV